MKKIVNIFDASSNLCVSMILWVAKHGQWDGEDLRNFLGVDS